MSNNPVSDSWARRIIRSVRWTEGFRGDNVRQTAESVYVGSGGAGDNAGPGADWRPRQFRVESEENDYLVCVAYNSQDEEAGDKQYEIAKAPDHRGDTVRRGVYPRYVPGETVIWAAPFRKNGAVGSDDSPILFMEVNLDARSAAWFPAKITASSSSSEDHTFVEVTAALADLANGRTATNAKCLNGRKGVPAGTYVFCLEVHPDAGDPEYYIQIPDGLTASPKDLVASGATADSVTYDIESDSEPVNYQPFRIYDDTGNSGNWYYFHRDIIADASGMITKVSAETRNTLPGDGYNELRKNNVLVDSVASNGVIDFDDQQTPGTNELVVEWTLTGDQDAVAGGANDGLRTQVQGLVDVSSVVGSGGGTNNIVAKLVKIDNTVTTGHYATLDDDDYSERIVAIHYDGQGSVSEATWGTANSPGAVGTWYIAGDTSPAGGEYDLFSLAGFRVFVDHGDSSKLKVEASSPGTYNYLSVVIIKGPQKSSEDIANGDFAAP